MFLNMKKSNLTILKKTVNHSYVHSPIENCCKDALEENKSIRF